MKKVLLFVFAFITVSSLLQAKDPEFWKEGKRQYRESFCNYKERCVEYCDQDERACNCFLELEDEKAFYEQVLVFLSAKIMEIYGWVATEEDLCKYVKQCYQYGYCPICNCEYSLSEEALKQLDEL